MKRAHVLASILLFAVVGFAQEPASNPQDRNPNDQTYTRPLETGGHNWGGWGLLGLLGLLGLAGRRRETTNIGTGYTRDDRTYGQQQRRVG